MVVRRVGHKPEDYRIDPEEQQVTTVFREVVRPPCHGVRGARGGNHDRQQRRQEQHRQQQLAGSREQGQAGEQGAEDGDPEVGEQAHPGDQEQVFDKNDGGYQINIASNFVYFDQAGVGTIARSTVAMGTGWHHIVATKTGAAVHIYLDGVDVTGSVTNRTLTDAGPPLILGARRGTTSAFLDGFLDEVAIYKSVLSPSRVAAHYAARQTP